MLLKVNRDYAFNEKRHQVNIHLCKDGERYIPQVNGKTDYKNAAINNLQVAIMEWDNENNDNMEDDESLMKKFIESKGFIILPKYLRYFQY